MRIEIAFLLLLTALTLLWRDAIGVWPARGIESRLSRLVPTRARGADETATEMKYTPAIYRLLHLIDFTFARFAADLRSLGVGSPSLVVAIETGKIMAGVSCAAIARVTARELISYPFAGWIALILGFSIVIIGANKLVHNASNSRLQKIRSELAVGLEFLCIFLEGGQTIDQAFRSFCEICGQALPRIASTQRALVADLKNGLPYEKAIQRWAENLNIEEAAMLAALMTESLVHGTELVPSLRQFAVDLVERRILAARESIGVKSVQLNAVMVLFFLPAILTFIAAPAITSLTASLEQSR